MSLHKLLRKIAGTKEKVQSAAKHDRLNLADDIRERSGLAKQVVVDRSQVLAEALGSEISVQPEDSDVNHSSSLSFQDFVLTSVAENPAANLISLVITSDTAESISVKKKHISIVINGGISTHDSIKALIEGSSRASALITVAINAGQGLVVVTAEDQAEFTGAL